MPDTYNPQTNYYMLTIKEKNGQFEHTTDVVVQAFNIEVARITAKRLVQNWYEANPYCCGFIFLFKEKVTVEVEAAVSVTPVELFERAIMGPRPEIWLHA